MHLIIYVWPFHCLVALLASLANVVNLGNALLQAPSTSQRPYQLFFVSKSSRFKYSKPLAALSFPQCLPKRCRSRCISSHQRHQQYNDGEDDICRDHTTEAKAGVIMADNSLEAKPSRRTFLKTTTSMVSSTIFVSVIGITDTERDAAHAHVRKRKAPVLPTETPIALLASRVLTVEDSLIRLLPISNSVFQNLLSMINDIASYGKTRSSEAVSKKCQATLQYLDNYRGKLEPTFDLDEENTMLQIMRSERFEQLIDRLRNDLESMLQYSSRGMTSWQYSSRGMTPLQVSDLYPLVKSSKITLSELGALLVKKFPYAVPTESALPRLLGRARVTFSLVRKTSATNNFSLFSKSVVPLGNVTIIADGYAAPLTAGNFVDLALRNFYTGLPVKCIKKRWKKVDDQAFTSLAGKLENVVVQLESTAQDLAVQTVQQIDEIIGVGGVKEIDSSVIPIFGSFQEGFIDPLTGKPRRIPLEIVFGGQQSSNFQYSLQEKTSSTIATAAPDSIDARDDRVTDYIDPFLTFDIPGLVAMNHPDRNSYGGSSEFFCLPLEDLVPARVNEINGQYAPFGYVVEGWDLLQNLDPSVEIASTYVDDWGRLKLVNKQSSFSDVLNSANTEESEASA